MTKRRSRKPQRKTTRTKKSKPIRVSADKQEEILGLMLILFGALVFIALFTFDPTETPDHITANSPIQNGLGWAGIYISYYFIRYTIGYPVMVLPLVLVAWGINRVLQHDTQQLKRISGLTLLFAFYVSVAFALHDVITALDGPLPEFTFSGAIGGFAANILVFAVGQYGAIILLIGIFLLTVLLSTTLSISQLVNSIEGYLVRSYYAVQDMLKVKLQPHPAKSKPKVIPASVPDSEETWEEKEISPIVVQRRIQAPPPVGTMTPEQIEMELPAEEEDDQEQDVEPVAAAPQPSVPYSEIYEKPPLDLLALPFHHEEDMGEEAYHQNARMLMEKLQDFGIRSQVTEIHPGPVITLYELELAPGIRVSRIMSLADDLAMAMRAKRIRIVAPIPGKPTIGIEIPNPQPEIVFLREIINTPDFQEYISPLAFAIGKDIAGKPYISDLAKMPHLLIAGSTGSGKSVCLNTVITSFLYKATPEEVQMVMIDPKRLELSNYAKLYQHHLNYVDGAKQKVATNSKTAIQMLKSVELEMESRYTLLAAAGVRNLEEYNERITNGFYDVTDDEKPKLLPYLIVIVDELADLMMTAGAQRDVEDPIARLTQMSRAVGIHMIVATQRPSVDVITGVIKANFPARIAFQVASKIDSRTILDMNGAEKLLGKGDMLFLPSGSPEPVRLHNAFIGLEEIEQIIEFIRHQPEFQKKPLTAFKEEEESGDYEMAGGDRDVLFEDAMRIVVTTGQGSVSILQRKLKVGYARAARLIDQLEEAGVVGPFEGSKAREVLISPAELEAMNKTQEDDFEDLDDQDDQDDF